MVQALKHRHTLEIKLKINDLTQTIGTKNVDTKNPTTPVNSKVNNGLSELCSFRVTTRYIP